ncbi:variant surface glycoprotein (VSG, atypical), putative [Trypanosoma brucei brucei TREU927]|uniref:Variant surface glycoprotein (VSG, atypical), putative n=1 Tax=Trypanosoma brucei brucei (strain 927/4 GUTat10.1) TaxID=185431 RepID=Q583L4_TRYB2|nr:variant surface glycoprotein (VSG, atypical), putative [Trypanosoma brucei brucei TREU927]AAX79079.1 variant surface glycoprotein (VSG, atypical), putative [Trypanosoma brucei]AAZ12078.1 variant surface glycoprotein (VSG, atypical), putative [Trypanosoma brucei brucei TREU927]
MFTNHYAALLFILFVAEYSQCDEHALKEATAEKICQYSLHGKTQARSLAAKLQALEGSLQRYTKAGAQVTLLQLHSSSYAEGAAVLGSFIAQKKQETQAKLKALRKDAPLAAAALGYGAGITEEFISLLKQPVAANRGDNTCTNPKNGNNLEQSSLNGCAPYAFSDSTSTSNYLTDYGSAPFPTGGGHFQTTKNCKLFQANLQTYLGADPSNTDKMSFGGGIIVLAKSTPLTDSNVKTSKTAVSHVNSVLQALEKLKPHLQSDLSPSLDSPEAVQAFLDGKAKEDLKDLLKQAEGKTADLTPTEIDNAIDKYFGKKDSDGKRGIIKQLEKEDFKIKTESSTKPTALLDMALDDTIRLTAEKIVELRKQAVTSEKQTCDTPVNADGCNEIKIEEDCNATAACSFNKTETDNNKKCKFNETKATANGVPVTQTQSGGTTTPSDRCTKHTKKEECEAENKNAKAGEKAVCSWIEDKCRDSSFLPNKKFAYEYSCRFMNTVIL